MLLSTLYTQVPDYIEIAWVGAPNAAEQNIPKNTLVTLDLNTIVADEGGHAALAGNVFTLPAGIYAFDAGVFVSSGTSAAPAAAMFSLYDVTAGRMIQRSGTDTYNYGRLQTLSGQFTAGAPKQLRLQALGNNNVALKVSNTAYNTTFTDSTADGAQRTTIKLWKLR